MALEQLANNASSTLGSSINSSVTSLTVASAATFPSSGEFRILIDTEIMKVTAVSSTTFTVSRGVEGTTAASHTSGAAVTGILTADAMRAYRENNNYFSAYSSRPTAAVVNRLFKPTDFPILQRDTGSLWTSIYGPSIDLVTPDDSGFSWTNQGSATVDTSLYGTYIECATNGNADNFESEVRVIQAQRNIQLLLLWLFSQIIAAVVGFYGDRAVQVRLSQQSFGVISIALSN
jgi:hypothetical protein